MGQHRECAALRGNGWGKKHIIVDYVFTYSPSYLVRYHILIMQEMTRRGYKVSAEWLQPTYRGLKCAPYESMDIGTERYPEHDEAYRQECLDNLLGKGIAI